VYACFFAFDPSLLPLLNSDSKSETPHGAVIKSAVSSTKSTGFCVLSDVNVVCCTGGVGGSVWADLGDISGRLWVILER
jgi:hypothetical protein